MSKRICACGNGIHAGLDLECSHCRQRTKAKLKLAKLLPCAHCKSAGRRVGEHTLTRHEDPAELPVECIGCGTRALTSVLWNTRPRVVKTKRKITQLTRHEVSLQVELTKLRAELRQGQERFRICEKRLASTKAELERWQQQQTQRMVAPLTWLLVREGGQTWQEARRGKLAFAIRQYGPTAIATFTKDGMQLKWSGTPEACIEWCMTQLLAEVQTFCLD